MTVAPGSGDPAQRAHRGDDGRVTTPDPLPPDPTEYDSPRAVRARAKGLDAPYIAGGTDPDPGRAQTEERRYWRLLVVMVVTIVAAGFVIGTVVALIGPTVTR